MLFLLFGQRFFAGNIDTIFNLLSISVTVPKINLLLPLGISFYTFQSAGYLIDLYRGKYLPDRNLAKYALFVSFFPQIIQGPIGRHDKLAHQLYAQHKFDYKQAKFGAQLIVWGFFKKLVIADRAAVLVNQVFGNYQQYAGLEIFIAVILYCFQLYADFSGGLDIATGIAQTMGINLAKNFKRPYFAQTISEFWQRWHITLGSWMRDYLFYPLCFSKSFVKLGKSARKTMGIFLGKLLPVCLATFIIFITIGAWHGAKWKYIAFGMYNGGLIILGLVFAPVFNIIIKKGKIRTKSLGWRLFQTSRTFLLCCIGRYFSRGPSLKTAFHMMSATVIDFDPKILFNCLMEESLNWGWTNRTLLYFVLLYLCFLSLVYYKNRDIIYAKSFWSKESLFAGGYIF